jgi:adenine-specific DNA-methyltransferase
MKYMGSKLSLLQNGLGDLLVREARKSHRFVDLFCGTGRVAWHVGELVELPVLAVDLQTYGAVLAGSVIRRDRPAQSESLVAEWIVPSRKSLPHTRTFRAAVAADLSADRRSVLAARALCESVEGGPVWRSYGGHYFSPQQAAAFDSLIQRLPSLAPESEDVCRAALVLAASRCAAAPGHTAQPFQPTDSALPYIGTSWQRDPIELAESYVRDLAARHSRVKGEALVADANDIAATLGHGDLVFVDPPYSSVHYSRFYHVLETVARGGCGDVEGVGRYPPPDERPSSLYSIKTQAESVMLDLLKRLAGNGCTVVLTFPQGDASNGLNGEQLAKSARKWFGVDADVVASRFSTLGGNGKNRSARRRAGELVLTMRPL